MPTTYENKTYSLGETIVIEEGALEIHVSGDGKHIKYDMLDGYQEYVEQAKKQFGDDYIEKQIRFFVDLGKEKNAAVEIFRTDAFSVTLTSDGATCSYQVLNPTTYNHILMAMPSMVTDAIAGLIFYVAKKNPSTALLIMGIKTAFWGGAIGQLVDSAPNSEDEIQAFTSNFIALGGGVVFGAIAGAASWNPAVALIGGVLVSLILDETVDYAFDVFTDKDTSLFTSLQDLLAGVAIREDNLIVDIDKNPDSESTTIFVEYKGTKQDFEDLKKEHPQLRNLVNWQVTGFSGLYVRYNGEKEPYAEFFGSDHSDPKWANDFFSASGLNSVPTKIHGYQGNDYLFGGSYADTIDGGKGNDYVDGHAGADIIYGDAEEDVNSTLGGRDTLQGSGGNDTIYGGGGNDSISGFISQGNLADSGPDDDNDLLIGGLGEDSIWGNDGNDFIYGDLEDLLSSQGHKDTLSGGDGRDTIYGGGGNDEIYGYAEKTGSPDHLFSTDNDILIGGTGNDTIHGNHGDDKIYGDFYTTTSTTGSGKDELHGGFGNDKIYGGGGHDVLIGGSGADELYGGAGDDWLYDDKKDFKPGAFSSRETDTLYGGAGQDAYVITGDNTLARDEGQAGEKDIYTVNTAEEEKEGWINTTIRDMDGAGLVTYKGSHISTVIMQEDECTTKLPPYINHYPPSL